jgi:hypothetical protein
MTKIRKSTRGDNSDSTHRITNAELAELVQMDANANHEFLVRRLLRFYVKGRLHSKLDYDVEKKWLSRRLKLATAQAVAAIKRGDFGD